MKPTLTRLKDLRDEQERKKSLEYVKWKLEALEFLITQRGGLTQIMANEVTVEELDPTGKHRREQYKAKLVSLQEEFHHSKRAYDRDRILSDISDYIMMLSCIAENP